MADKRLMWERFKLGVTERFHRHDNTAVREAAIQLASKLRAIHGDVRYQSVWACAQAHQGPYDGPQYEDELRRLEEAFNA